MKRFFLLMLLAGLGLLPVNSSQAATVFESAMIGTTGVTWQQALNGDVPGENINSSTFSGVRFELTQSVMTNQVGGHFVDPPNTDTTLFASIIELDNANDFPDSEDLSTSDVLGHTLLTFPEPSDEAYGNLELFLSPGWYAIIFGSGLFGANGDGGVISNSTDIGNPDYIGFLSGFGWGNRLSSKHFVIKGIIIPEPTTLSLSLSALLFMMVSIRSSSSKFHRSHSSRFAKFLTIRSHISEKYYAKST